MNCWNNREEEELGFNGEEEDLSFNGGSSDEEDALSRVAGQLNSNFRRHHIGQFERRPFGLKKKNKRKKLIIVFFFILENSLFFFLQYMGSGFEPRIS